MAKLIRKKIYNTLNEDDAQQQNQLQPAAAPQNNALPQNNAAPAPANQPLNNANNQQANAQQNPQLNQQQALNNLNQQQQQPAGPNMTEVVTKINNFTASLYQQIQNSIKAELEKQVPEIVTISKDSQSPYAAEAKKVGDAFTALTKIQIKPEDAKSVSDTITQFGSFMQTLSGFNKFVTDQLSKLPQGDLNNNDAANNQTQPLNAAAPLQQGQNESMDWDLFGSVLAEKLYQNKFADIMNESGYF